ncbi:MAG TPA: hypothetical protein VLA05_00990 [Coriobacteriia bacterium]|nr:hypothetical protein [Coriobacteriia bacterium]
MIDALSILFLSLGFLAMLAALILIFGFVLSMPVGLAFAIKDHHEHPAIRAHKREHHMPKFHRPNLHMPAVHMPDFRSFRKRR